MCNGLFPSMLYLGLVVCTTKPKFVYHNNRERLHTYAGYKSHKSLPLYQRLAGTTQVVVAAGSKRGVGETSGTTTSQDRWTVIIQTDIQQHNRTNVALGRSIEQSMSSCCLMWSSVRSWPIYRWQIHIYIYILCCTTAVTYLYFYGQPSTTKLTSRLDGLTEDGTIAIQSITR